jgi:hypothetical protein
MICGAEIAGWRLLEIIVTAERHQPKRSAPASSAPVIRFDGLTSASLAAGLLAMLASAGRATLHSRNRRTDSQRYAMIPNTGSSNGDALPLIPSPEQLAHALGGGKAKQVGSKWRMLCPVHDGGTPSFDIAECDGTLQLCCRSGCSQNAVIDACIALGHLHDAAIVLRADPRSKAAAKFVDWKPHVPPPGDAPRPAESMLQRDPPSGMVWGLSP